jgi:hypothetical protein
MERSIDISVTDAFVGPAAGLAKTNHQVVEDNHGEGFILLLSIT